MRSPSRARNPSRARRTSRLKRSASDTYLGFDRLRSSKGEIRLLILTLGPENSLIEGRVHVGSLQPSHLYSQYWNGISEREAQAYHAGVGPRRTYYEALSYEWGDPIAPTFTILLNGRPFKVRENLLHALLTLRRMKVSIPLWIDAICINQEDVQERNEQVRLMDSIYKLAANVRVWFGRDGRSISGAFRFVSQIATACLEEHRRRGWDAVDTEDFDYTCAKDVVAQKEGWKALMTFMEQSYWTRIWIVQEYLLGRNIQIHCDRETIDGRDLETAINSIDHLRTELDCPTFIDEAVVKLDNSAGKKIIDMRHKRGERTLAELLDSTKISKCQDPHDRIYAIIALADDVVEFNKEIPIDYNRSIAQVKVDVVGFTRARFASTYDISRIRLLLNRIFADCTREM